MSEKTNPEVSKLFTRVADLSPVWDCRCEIEKLYECISAVHLLALDYLNEDAKTPFCVLICAFAEKLNELNKMLSKTIDQSQEVKNDNEK